MASSYTTNKNIEEPSSGSYQNAWASPVNANWVLIDTALGGTAVANLTTTGSGTYTIPLAVYQPPNIELIGTITGNIVAQFPAGVGGLWSVYNNVTGNGTVTIASAGGGTSLTLPVAYQGYRAYVVCDGTNVQLADSYTLQYAQTQANVAATTAQTNAEAFATAADAVVTTNTEAYAAAQAAAAQSAAQAYALSVGVAAQSANANGYIQFSNGIIVQWGFGTYPSVTFPIAFPNNCWSIIPTSYVTNAYVYLTSSYNSKSTFSVGGLSGVEQFYWIAIGN